MDDINNSDLSKLIGKKVIRHEAVVFEDDENFSEVGIIVHAWIDPELDAIDCYVAFFGEVWPELGEKPNDIPYVLRYLLSSLEEAK
jgi:predicted dienelactone hydrolase